MRHDYEVGPGTADELARAVYRYRLRQPMFFGLVALEVAFAVVFAATGHWALAAVFALMVLALPVLGLRHLPRLARGFRANGFRPGTTVRIDWGPETFAVHTAEGSAEHRYDAVRTVHRLGRAVVAFLGSSRVLLVLPAELVPPGYLPGPPPGA